MLMYGRGIASIADQIKPKDHPVATKEDIAEAQKIQEDFFNSFPKVRKWMDETNANAKKFGYVEDLWGRKRRLPDIQLPDFSYELESSLKFNPLLGTSNNYEDPALKSKALDYIKQVKECKYNAQKEKIKDEAAKQGIIIHNNLGYISQAERQCINARVQGSSASMSKKAMINVHNDQRLNELGFRLLFPVHDELIGECPIENAEEVKERLSYLMIHSAEPECTVPMKCDADDFKSWYLDVYTADVKKEYEDLKKSNTEEDAFKLLYKDHTECTEEQLKNILEIA